MSTPPEFISLELLEDIGTPIEELLAISVDNKDFTVTGSLVQELLVPPREVFPKDYSLSIVRIIDNTYCLLEKKASGVLKVQGSKSKVLDTWMEIVESLTA